MITLITGKPGHGKNIYTLNLLERSEFIVMDADSGKFMVTLPEERSLHFIAFDGIDIIDAQTATYRDLDLLPLDQDGLKDNKSVFPEGSVVVIDEAHLCAPKSQNKEGFTRFVSFLKIHRHAGFDFILITQAQKDLNIDIRALVDYHFQVIRPFGGKSSFANKFQGCETRDNPRPLKIENRAFKIDPKYFEVYKSASIHNVKSSIPFKFWVYGFLFLCLLSFVGYTAKKAWDSWSSGEILGGISNSIVDVATPAGVPKPKKANEKPKAPPPPPEPLIRYFYKYKHPSIMARHLPLFSSLGIVDSQLTITPFSLFCVCTKDTLAVLKNMISLTDISKKIQVNFFVISMDDNDFRNFEKSYSFKASHFIVNGGFAIGNEFLFSYLEKDFKSFTYSKTSSLVNIGNTFESSALTDYPRILLTYKNDGDGSDGNTTDSTTTSEEVLNTTVGYSFKMSTALVSKGLVKFQINQEYSSIGDFVDKIPIVSSRSFKSTFDLTAGSLVPLFSSDNLLRRSSNSSSIPFLSGLFPPNKENTDSNYRFFLSYNGIYDNLADIGSKKAIKHHIKVIERSTDSK